MNKGNSETEFKRSSTDSKNRDTNSSRETFNKGNLLVAKGASNNGFKNIDLKGEESANDELPVSQMMIKLENVHEDVSSLPRKTPVQNLTKEVDVNETPKHSQSRQTIPAPNNPAVSTPTQIPPDTHTSRLKADEEHFSDGDDAFSTQAILSAYTKKTEKLFNNLNEVVTTHSRTSVKERVELIKRYYSRMNEQDQK